MLFYNSCKHKAGETHCITFLALLLIRLGQRLTNTAAVVISCSSRPNCHIKCDRIQPILMDMLKGRKPGFNLIFPPHSSCVKHHQTAEGALPEVRGQLERQRHCRHLSLTHAGSTQRPHSFPHEAVHKQHLHTAVCASAGTNSVWADRGHKLWLKAPLSTPVIRWTTRPQDLHSRTRERQRVQQFQHCRNVSLDISLPQIETFWLWLICVGGD